MLGQSWDLRQVLRSQWGLVGGKREFLWLYYWSLFGVLGGSGAWSFWSFSLCVFVWRVSWMKVWSMAAWIMLSLPTSRNRLYGFCWCTPRKSVFRSNGYPKNFIDSCIKHFLDKLFDKRKVSLTVPKVQLVCMLPYPGKSTLDSRARLRCTIEKKYTIL